MELKPFVNHIGQTIEVGEEVVMIAMAQAGRKRIRTGIYLGQTNGQPTCSWQSQVMRYLVNGQQMSWKIDGGKWEYVDHPHRSTLRKGKVYKINTSIVEVFCAKNK